MGNAYIGAILIKVTNIHLVFTLTQSWKIVKYFFNRFVFLTNSDWKHHGWLMTKPNLDFGKTCKYSYKYIFFYRDHYTEWLLHLISLIWVWYQDTFIKQLFVHINDWVKVKTMYILVTLIKMDHLAIKVTKVLMASTSTDYRQCHYY